MSGIPQNAIERLRARVHGRVLIPGDADFDQARQPWNRAVAQMPAAVVEAADAADVAAALSIAAEHAIPVAPQSTGHGATGRADGAMLLRTHRLDEIRIDPEAKTAYIGAGVQSGRLQRAAAEHGLTALPGSSPVVGVTGVALGGGLSWFGRAIGWVADSILSADVVLADGTTRHVDESDPELLWALRGGGGEVAVVTGLELRLQAAPTVFGGRMLWAGVHARRVADAYRTLTETAPPELSLWLELLHFPGAEPMVAIDATFLGDEAEGRRLMSVVDGLPASLSDSRAAMSVAELGGITAEPTEPGAGHSRGELLTALDDAALDALVAEPIAPLLSVQVRHLGAALAAPSDSPHGPLAEPYALFLFGLPTSPEVTAALDARMNEIVGALPVSGRKPMTFLSPTESSSDALPEASLRRLRALKDDLDPAGILRGNYPLR